MNSDLEEFNDEFNPPLTSTVLNVEANSHPGIGSRGRVREVDVLAEGQAFPLQGKIHFIAVKNFVTYDNVVCFPGDFLNIIIGPNGTGKSTLMAAVVLGMGGSPSILSRSSDIGEYIKNGCDTAIIDIGIYQNNDRDVIVFTRSFDLNARNVWKINNKAISHKDYMATVQEFNIQIDNLCQFLPQDRVQDFAKMNPQELLRNTQNAVCDEEMSSYLNNLIQWRSKQNSAETEMENNKKSLREHQNHCQKLQIAIDTMNERKELEKKAEIGQKKKAWMEFEQCYVEFQENKTELKQANEIVSKHKETLTNLMKHGKQIIEKRDKFKTKVSAAEKTYQKFLSDLEKSHEQSDLLESEITRARNDLQFLISSTDEKKAEIQQAVDIVISLQSDLINAREKANECQTRKDSLTSMISDLQIRIQQSVTERKEVCAQIDALRPELVGYERQMQKMDNVANIKLKNLESKFHYVYESVMWFRANKGIFKGRVYEPMILELNVVDSNNAKYFENTIGMKDLLAFTCEDKDDTVLLLNKLKNEQNINVNILHSPSADCVDSHYRPRIPLQQMKKYGVKNYLLELVEGPAPILNLLCRMYQIHNIPVCDQRAYEISEQFPAECPLFFTRMIKFV